MHIIRHQDMTAAQRDARPLLPSGCNGNCSQGRMCDCVPAVDETDAIRPGAVLLIFAGYVMDKLRMSPSAWLLAGVLGILSCALAVHLWRAS